MSVMVTDRSHRTSCIQCRKSRVTYGVMGMKNLQKRKVRSKNKVRALFRDNKVRFARAEQL